jgi:hypothetical protein
LSIFDLEQVARKRAIQKSQIGNRQSEIHCPPSVENSEGLILSFPGSLGYKSFEHATVDEINRAKALLNQGRAMVRSWLRYQKRFHRGT